jgi:hypothetical protein
VKVTENAGAAHRQQQLYWTQLVELKVASCYIRRYRDSVAKWVVRLGVLRAVASSGAIAGWALWHEFAFVWACIIAASQLADALKEVFPFTRIHKAASEHTVALDSLFIDTQLEWENIYAGRFSDIEIMNHRHKLMKLQHDAERKNFPEGLTIDVKLFDLAEKDAETYLQNTYETGATNAANS